MKLFFFFLVCCCKHMVVFSHLFSTFSLLSSSFFFSPLFFFTSFLMRKKKKKRRLSWKKGGRDDNTRLLVHNADTSRLLRVLPLVFAYSETTVFTVPKGRHASSFTIIIWFFKRSSRFLQVPFSSRLSSQKNTTTTTKTHQ